MFSITRSVQIPAQNMKLCLSESKFETSFVDLSSKHQILQTALELSKAHVIRRSAESNGKSCCVIEGNNDA